MTEPLLGQDAPDDNNAANDASKLEMLLAIDESTEWNEEGNLSICTSLSSLDNDSITGVSSTSPIFFCLHQCADRGKSSGGTGTWEFSQYIQIQ